MVFQPQTRAYELVDPRTADVPRFVSFGAGPVPWWPRWLLRDVDGAKVGAWFRSLDSDGVLPIESHRWLPTLEMEGDDAKRVARARIRQICQWCKTWPAVPSFLCTEHFGRLPVPNKSPIPVLKLNPDGTAAEHFPSIAQAARVRGTIYEGIRYYLVTGHADKDGCRYVVARQKSAPR